MGDGLGEDSYDFNEARGFDDEYDDPHAFAIQNCRSVCYSDLMCNYWQFVTPFGCFTENPRMGSSHVVPYPLTEADVAPAFVEDQYEVQAGEFIQHTCHAVDTHDAAGAEGPAGFSATL